MSTEVCWLCAHYSRAHKKCRKFGEKTAWNDTCKEFNKPIKKNKV